MEISSMKRVAKVAAFASLFFMCAVFADVERADAQVVTSYYAPAPVYAPAPAVGYVPVRRGLFGWRVGYRPVVAYPTVVAAPAYVAPPVFGPTTTYYRAPVVAPIVIAPRVRAYYRPILPRRVYYAPARAVFYPPVYYR